MMLRRNFWIIALSIVAFSAQIGLPQEQPKPVLVDEFGEIQCGDLLARTDTLFSELMQHPADVGFAIIYTSGRNTKGYKKFITASMYFRQFDPSRLKVVLASDSKESFGQFWRVPPGADLPEFTEIREPEPDFTKPFIVGNVVGEDVCPSFDPRGYAEMIKSHPSSIARIVVYGPSWLERQQYANYSIERFESEFDVPQKRIQFYFVHRPEKAYTEAEYWFIPAKKK